MLELQTVWDFLWSLAGIPVDVVLLVVGLWFILALWRVNTTDGAWAFHVSFRPFALLVAPDFGSKDRGQILTILCFRITATSGTG